MGTTKQDIKQFALSKGFCDIRFADAGEILAFTKDKVIDPRTLLSSATCIIVLYMRYYPSCPAPEGSMALSSYYIASHRSYHAARDVAAYLISKGGEALHTTALPARAAALRAGGFVGDNGFYYHPEFGSFVCIQTVLTNAFEPDTYPQSLSACLHCGACERACPSSGVTDMQKCLRFHINTSVPEDLRGSVYQLLGCEKCQSACPLNCADRDKPYVFALDSLLDGSQTAAIRELVGPNMARRGRLISQAALYAANTSQRQLLAALWTLAQSEDEPVRTHACWAYDKLNGENND